MSDFFSGCGKNNNKGKGTICFTSTSSILMDEEYGVLDQTLSLEQVTSKGKGTLRAGPCRALSLSQHGDRRGQGSRCRHPGAERWTVLPASHT